MGRERKFNDIVNDNGWLQKKPSMSMSLRGIIREEPFDEELVDIRADEIVSQLRAENIRALVCDVVRFINSNYIDQAVKMSCQKGIRCPAARFNSLCYKYLVKSPLYQEAKSKRMAYRRRVAYH